MTEETAKSHDHLDEFDEGDEQDPLAQGPTREELEKMYEQLVTINNYNAATILAGLREALSGKNPAQGEQQFKNTFGEFLGGPEAAGRLIQSLKSMEKSGTSAEDIVKALHEQILSMLPPLKMEDLAFFDEPDEDEDETPVAREGFEPRV
jgi:hypothetical protein